MKLIKVRALKKSYGKLRALNDVNMQIEKGSIYGLLGSNGAGKTTLLKIISGIYKGDEGEVTIEGKEIFENVENKNRLIFIADDTYFFPQYTIKDMANMYEGIYKAFNKDRFEKLKEVFELDVNRKISSLSKGMKRQVAFWLSLSLMPEILVLDEPLDGLDPVMRQKIKNLLIQDVANREMTIIISSHNLREIEDICDYIGIIHKGIVVLQKDLDDLKSDIHKVQIAFKEELPCDLEGELCIIHKEERGSVKLLISKGDKEEIISKIKKYNPVILDILPLTLEEIFIYEMGDLGYEIKNVLL